MISKEAVLKVVEEYANTHELFVVEVLVKKDKRVIVYIDSLIGLQLNDCIKLSRHIEENFDREAEDYALEVSSPGLDYPLRMPQQFQKNLNRELVILLTNGVSIKGILKSHNTESIGIEYERISKEGKKKRKENIIEDIPLSSIKEAKVKVAFK